MSILITACTSPTGMIDSALIVGISDIDVTLPGITRVT